MRDENNSDRNRREPERRRLGGHRRRGRGGGFYIGLFILLIVILSAGYWAVDRFMPNFEVIPLHQFYADMDPDAIYMIVGEDRIDSENHPVLQNDELYLPVDFVKEYIDPYIFWDESVGRLTITTENKVIQMKTEELAYYINDRPFNLNIPVHEIGGVAYIPAALLMDLYDVGIRYDDAYRQVLIDDTAKERTISKVIVKSADLRYDATIKSPIEEKLLLDTAILSYGQAGDFTKVRTDNGLIGYVKTKDIAFDRTILAVVKEDTDTSAPDKKPIAGKINILWDQLSTAEASADIARRITHDSLDVLSPTWFSFDDEALNGDIVNIADRGYVDWAHAEGYQVWGLITDNFKREVSHAVLSDTTIREYVVKQLLAFVSLYDLDGINIDFENVGEEDADYYIQFLRELYPRMLQAGVTLSVDLTVPKPFNMYYNRTEVAKASDYVIIMGYDEHYSTSPVSGSVASIGFVAEGVAETLKEVPKEKTILGMPYYVRVWREIETEDGEIDVSSKAYSMSDAIALFESNGAAFAWLEATANDYAEYILEEDGEAVTYKVWLENERSLEEKLKIMEQYDLAGVAGWSSYWLQGEDRDKILDLVERYVKR